MHIDMTGKVALVTGASRKHAAFISGTTLTIDGGKLAGTRPFKVKAGPR